MLITRICAEGDYLNVQIVKQLHFREDVLLNWDLEVLLERGFNVKELQSTQITTLCKICGSDLAMSEVFTNANSGLCNSLCKAVYEQDKERADAIRKKNEENAEDRRTRRYKKLHMATSCAFEDELKEAIKGPITRAQKKNMNKHKKKKTQKEEEETAKKIKEDTVLEGEKVNTEEKKLTSASKDTTTINDVNEEKKKETNTMLDKDGDTIMIVDEYTHETEDRKEDKKEDKREEELLVPEVKFEGKGKMKKTKHNDEDLDKEKSTRKQINLKELRRLVIYHQESNKKITTRDHLEEGELTVEKIVGRKREVSERRPSTSTGRSSATISPTKVQTPTNWNHSRDEMTKVRKVVTWSEVSRRHGEEEKRRRRETTPHPPPAPPKPVVIEEAEPLIPIQAYRYIQEHQVVRPPPPAPYTPPPPPPAERKPRLPTLVDGPAPPLSSVRWTPHPHPHTTFPDFPLQKHEVPVAANPENNYWGHRERMNFRSERGRDTVPETHKIAEEYVLMELLASPRAKATCESILERTTKEVGMRIFTVRTKEEAESLLRKVVGHGKEIQIALRNLLTDHLKRMVKSGAITRGPNNTPGGYYRRKRQNDLYIGHFHRMLRDHVDSAVTGQRITLQQVSTSLALLRRLARLHEQLK